MQLNATHKGLLTGIAMILVFVLFYYLHNFNSPLLFITYIIYAIGILWTLIPFAGTADNDWKFKSFFSEGFKCFIIVTLLMVAFWWAFYKLNPDIIEQMIVAGRKAMQQQGNSTPAEIDAKVIEVRKSAPTILTSVNVIKYLILGLAITAFSSLLIIQKGKKK
jgi:uncharacterized protein DUF4199